MLLYFAGQISEDMLRAMENLNQTSAPTLIAADVHEQKHSPAIDAGDPKSPYKNEPKPCGWRVNLGAYGNTPEAMTSKQGLMLFVR